MAAPLAAVPTDDFMLSEDVADVLGVSRSTVQEWLGQGRIPHRKMPGTRRCLVPVKDFQAWLDGAELEMIPLAAGGRIVRPVAKRRAA